MGKNNNYVEEIRQKYPVGTRIRLIRMGNDPRPVPAGTIGTVTYVDDIGSIGMNWENGQSLALIVGEDDFEIIEDKNENKLQEAMEIESWGRTYQLYAQVDSYVYGGGIAVLLWNVTEEGDLEPFCNLTTNLEKFPSLGTKTAFIDSNNFDGAEALIEKYKLGKPTGRIGCSGFCTYPEYLFDVEELSKYAVEVK